MAALETYHNRPQGFPENDSFVKTLNCSRTLRMSIKNPTSSVTLRPTERGGHRVLTGESSAFTKERGPLLAWAGSSLQEDKERFSQKWGGRGETLSQTFPLVSSMDQRCYPCSGLLSRD